MRLVLWDFDGTLAERPGRWRRCLVEAAERLFPVAEVDSMRLGEALRRGFPWHEPMTPHPHLNDPEAWWARVEPHLVRSLAAAGLDETQSRVVGREARSHYTDASSFVLYPDAKPALDLLRGIGWRHAIISNHVPELPAIVSSLGIGQYFDAVVTSAAIGYEKPHPMAFKTVLDMFRPGDAWMVGDNREADVVGAQAVGIKAILVARDEPTARPLLAAATTIAEDEIARR